MALTEQGEGLDAQNGEVHVAASLGVPLFLIFQSYHKNKRVCGSGVCCTLIGF